MIEQRVAALGNRYPQTLDFFDDLNAAGIPWAGAVGFAVSVLVGWRSTADVDLVIPEGSDAFTAVADLMPGSTVDRGKEVAFWALDGTYLYGEFNRVTARLDNGTEVEVMQPIRHLSHDKHAYRIALTPMATEHRLSYLADTTTVYIENPVDTVFTKGIMQRGAKLGKHDRPDALALSQLPECDMTSDYARARAEEMNVDPRVRTFCSSLAVQPSVERELALV